MGRRRRGAVRCSVDVAEDANDVTDDVAVRARRNRDDVMLAQRFGWDSALYVAAALALLGAFLWLGVHPERAIDLGEDASALPHKQGVAGVESHG